MIGWPASFFKVCGLEPSELSRTILIAVPATARTSPSACSDRYGRSKRYSEYVSTRVGAHSGQRKHIPRIDPLRCRSVTEAATRWQCDERAGTAVASKGNRALQNWAVLAGVTEEDATRWQYDEPTLNACLGAIGDLPSWRADNITCHERPIGKTLQPKEGRSCGPKPRSRLSRTSHTMHDLSAEIDARLAPRLPSWPHAVMS